jgi:hypothetical protein
VLVALPQQRQLRTFVAQAGTPAYVVLATTLLVVVVALELEHLSLPQPVVQVAAEHLGTLPVLMVLLIKVSRAATTILAVSAVRVVVPVVPVPTLLIRVASVLLLLLLGPQ